MINLLNPDGTFNENAGAYAGLDRSRPASGWWPTWSARAAVEGRAVPHTALNYSDRSKTPIEPYLSDQWFVRMGELDGSRAWRRGHELIEPREVFTRNPEGEIAHAVDFDHPLMPAVAQFHRLLHRHRIEEFVGDDDDVAFRHVVQRLVPVDRYAEAAERFCAAVASAPD